MPTKNETVKYLGKHQYYSHECECDMSINYSYLYDDKQIAIEIVASSPYFSKNITGFVEYIGEVDKEKMVRDETLVAQLNKKIEELMARLWSGEIGEMGE